MTWPWLSARCSNRLELAKLSQSAQPVREVGKPVVHGDVLSLEYDGKMSESVEGKTGRIEDRVPGGLEVDVKAIDM